jgi:PEGA domain
VQHASGGWLVPPDRADAFAPPVDDPPSPPPPTEQTYPLYVPPAETESWTPELEPPPAIEIAPLARPAPPPSAIKLQSGPASGGIRLKDESAGHAGATARADQRHEPVDLSAVGSYEPFSSFSEPQPFPWKLIAAGVGLIAITFALTKGLLPSDIPTPTLGKREAVEVKKAPPPAPPTTAGHLSVTTEPAGVRVLVDGKFVGATPLTLDTVTPGRHVVTLQATGGAIKRTIRVEAGKTVSLDMPVYSGFAAISAPFIVDVAENGRTLGTSDEQIILGPGHHELILHNKDLNYTEKRGIDVEPGEATKLVLDPRGTANINAAPWAEVYIDGEKAGDTPLANVSIRLGVREILFKNPQFPDRKIVTTIKAGAAATISVDFAKDK